jgi:hypothetical protein
VEQLIRSGRPVAGPLRFFRRCLHHALSLGYWSSGLWLILCFCPVSSTAQPGVEIVATVPTQNALNVPPATSIAVTFNADMDESTLTDANIVVTATMTGHHSGTVLYDPASRSASYNPDRDFVPGDVVSVTVTTRVQSSRRTPLSTAYCWSFTVAVAGGAAVFDSAGTYATGGEPTSMLAVDLDDDGDLDLAVGSYGDGAVAIHRNDGAAGFTLDSAYAVGYGPYSLAAGDFDLDGDIDLAASVETSEYFGWVAVMLNDGNGILASAVDYPTSGASVAVYAADLDGDGDLDLASIDGLATDKLSVLLNAGDGTFVFNDSYAAGGSPIDVTAGDLDGDGDVDLASVDLYADSVSIFFNDGHGAFTLGSAYWTGQRPQSVVAADFDGDGDLDLVTGNEYPEYMAGASVLLNNGDGTFGMFTGNYLGGIIIFGTCSVAAADIDNDGDLDIEAASSVVTTLLNNGQAEFGESEYYLSGANPWDLIAADLDGDGDIDLATGNSGSDDITILLNRTPCECPHQADWDEDGLRTALDLGFLIDVLYAGETDLQDPGCPTTRFDFDCDGFVTGLDLSGFVDHLFAGEPGPCDPCGL